VRDTSLWIPGPALLAWNDLIPNRGIIEGKPLYDIENGVDKDEARRRKSSPDMDSEGMYG
jgi:hypothetical protein